MRSRRLNLRYRPRDSKKPQFCHTLNNTVIASPRVLIPLLEIHRVRRQVPVHHRMAVGVEVEAFLPDRSARQHEGPERRIERGPHLISSVHRTAFV